MADLLSTMTGEQILDKIACFLGTRRISRQLKRRFMLAFEAYKVTGTWDRSILLGELNAADQDQILAIASCLDDIGCNDIVKTDEFKTTGDMDIYIEYPDGSDIDGDGSIDKPYASLKHAADVLPKYINHKVRIHVLTDLTVTQEVYFDQTLGRNGELAVFGEGKYATVSTSIGAGPFAVTNCGTYGGPTPAAHWIQVGVAWNVDELYGSWIRFLTGDAAGECQPVHKNVASELYTHNGWNGTIAPGDVFEIVTPSISVKTHHFTMALKGMELDALFVANVGLFNIEIDATGNYDGESAVQIKNYAQTFISFVTIKQDEEKNGTLLSGEINRYRCDNTALTASSSDIGNIGYSYANPGTQEICCPGLLIYQSNWINGPSTSYAFSHCKIGQENRWHTVVGVDCRGMMYIEGKTGLLRCSSIGTLVVTDGGYAECYYTFHSGRMDDNDGTVKFQKISRVYLKQIFFQEGKHCIVGDDGRAVIDNCFGNAAPEYSGFGIYITGFVRIHLKGSPTQIVGTAGNINFPIAGPSAHPLVGNAVFDQLGNWVSYP